MMTMKKIFLVLIAGGLVWSCSSAEKAKTVPPAAPLKWTVPPAVSRPKARHRRHPTSKQAVSELAKAFDAKDYKKCTI